MAFPLIPVAIVALIAMAAGGGKKKRRTALPPANGGAVEHEPELYAFALEDFLPDEPIDLDILPGDMIRFDLATAVGPHSWSLYTEAIEGDPVLQIEEDLALPGEGDQPGTPARYIVDVIAHPGKGTVKMDFVLTSDIDQEVLESKTALVTVV